jgi:hypothetical protein
MTHNLHSMNHICDEAERIGLPLDRFSAFPFENFLGIMKKQVKSPNHIAVQLVNKLNMLIERDFNLNDAEDKLILQGKGFKINNVIFSTKSKNAFVLLINGEVAEITECAHDKRNVKTLIIKAKVFKNSSSVYTFLIKSSYLGILKVNKDDFKNATLKPSRTLLSSRFLLSRI